MKTETCQYLITDGYSHTQCGQVEFAEFAATRPILYGVARSVSDAIAIVEE